MKQATVQLVNPWSGSTAKEMSWLQIRHWAKSHIHPIDQEDWLKVAKEAFDESDGETLGRMIIGS